MIARLKSTGAYVDVYKEGSVIGKNGVEGRYYRFGDTAKLVIYGSELVFEKDNEGQALLYAVEKTAERTKKEVIEKIAEWMRNFKDGQGNFPLYDYVGNLKQAMQDERKDI